MKSQNYGLSGVDDTSLNGIKLFCGDPALDTTPEVTSLVGHLGEWRAKHKCYGGYITGFQLRVQTPVAGSSDETATNNIRIFCSNSENYNQGDGENWGTWSEERHCKENQAVCGIKTQVQADQEDAG